MDFIDNKVGVGAGPPGGAMFDPEPRAKTITLRLAMTCGLTSEELAEYDKLDADAAFERVGAVRSLHLEWQGFTEISSLDAFDNVEYLYLQYNRIERMDCLDCLTNLRFLALQHNRIRVVEGLLDLRQLGFLDVSKNLIGQLDVMELPRCLLILNMEGNACTEDEGYRERVLGRCPKLEDLDGRSLETGRPVAETGAAGSAAAEGELKDVKGMTAYWQRGAMQDGMAEQVKDLIDSYSAESQAERECDHFGARIECAVERSVARRKDFAVRPKTPLDQNMGTSLKLNGSLTKGQLAEIRRLSDKKDGADVADVWTAPTAPTAPTASGSEACDGL